MRWCSQLKARPPTGRTAASVLLMQEKQDLPELLLSPPSSSAPRWSGDPPLRQNKLKAILVCQKHGQD